MLETMTPTDFVVLANQTLEYVYPVIRIQGEVKNLKVNRNKWLFFDIADEYSKVKCFGTVYNLPGPIDDGMMVVLKANPKLHSQYGFSLNIQSIVYKGEGTIKKASDILKQKLAKEGLFDESRKREITYPPESIGLITSLESAAYHDFIKIINARFSGVKIEVANVAVQGEQAGSQIPRAIKWFNAQPDLVDVLVMIRGGGSADDLQAFSNEQIVRAVSVSRIPTLVAIGHEVDVALAELAADKRASTPSNAAELLVPDKRVVLDQLDVTKKGLLESVQFSISDHKKHLLQRMTILNDVAKSIIKNKKHKLDIKAQTLKSYSPRDILERGYASVRLSNRVVKSVKSLNTGDSINVHMRDGSIDADVTSVNVIDKSGL